MHRLSCVFSPIAWHLNPTQWNAKTSTQIRLKRGWDVTVLVPVQLCQHPKAARFGELAAWNFPPKKVFIIFYIDIPEF